MSVNCDCGLAGDTEVKYSGSKTADIAIVGESPGQQEVRLGRPFVGPAGKLIQGIVSGAGLSWPELAILNSARCMLLKDQLSAKQLSNILAACRPKLERALRHIKPKVIVCLGNEALRQITRKSGITKHRGRWLFSKEFDCWVLPAFHPAYILRNPGKKPLLQEDINKVKAFVDAGYRHKKAKCRYVEVQTLQPLLDKLDEGIVRVALDTETTGLDWLDPETLVLCYSITYGKGQGWYVELCREATDGIPITVQRVPEGKKKAVPVDIYLRPDINIASKIRDLQLVLEHPNARIYMQNGNFDRHMLNELFRRNDFPESNFKNWRLDTQAAAHVLNETLYTQASLEDLQFGLTDLAEDYSGDFKRNYSYGDMPGVPKEEMIRYACGDADTTWRAGQVLVKDNLAKKANRALARYYAHVAHPSIQFALYELEKNGSLIDTGAIPAVKDKIAERLAVLEETAIQAIPPRIRARHEEKGLRLSRRDILRDALFDKEGYKRKPEAMTKSGAPSVDRNALQEMLDGKLPKKARTLVESYVDWNELHTLYTRYLKGFENSVRSDRRIHSSFNICKATTGRVASSSPNLMNIPARGPNASVIRRLIVAPPGKALLAMDQSQAELRWAAHLSGDREMIRVYKAGEDIHTNTAEALTGKKRAQMSPEEFKKHRKSAKAVNFGLLYLMTTGGFVRYSKQQYGIVLSFDEAQEWINTFFARYPRLRDYHRKTTRFCERYGYVVSPLGRRRHLPEINDDEKSVRAVAARQAVNHPIQSASSDTVLIAINEILRKRLVDPNECKLVNFIHDEVVWEVDNNPEAIERNFRIIKHQMEHPPLHRVGVKLRVPLVVDGKVGPNLAEMKEISQ
jgi:uracil-DNA glycosylase family 4